MENIVKIIASFLGTSIVYLLGGFDIALQALIVAIVIDYLTGLAKSYVSGKLNSNKGFKGIIKKMCYLAIVAVSVIIDRTCGDTGLIRNVIIYYFVANEGLSIVENCAEMDIMVPNVLKEKLEQLKQGSGNNE